MNWSLSGSVGGNSLAKEVIKDQKMNERIRELAKQACFLQQEEESIEYFAQLIVQACANICDDIADPCLNRNQDIHQRMAPGASYASKVIKLRFLE